MSFELELLNVATSRAQAVVIVVASPMQDAATGAFGQRAVRSGGGGGVALRLPLDVRAALAADLLESLDGAEPAHDREAAWAQEVQRRLAAWESGEMQTVSHSLFLTNLGAAGRGSSSA